MEVASPPDHGVKPGRISILWRVVCFWLGALFCAVGVPLGWLFGQSLFALGQPGGPSPSELVAQVAGFAVFLGMTAMGIDLLGRGIVGRRWSAAFWDWLIGLLQKPWAQVAAVFAFVLLLCAIGLPNWRDPSSWQLFYWWLAFGCQVLVHELGHLAAVFAVGYAPRSLTAGSLVIRFGNGRPRLGFKPSVWFVLWGRVDFDRVQPGLWKDTVVTLCGPLANAVICAAILALPPFGGVADRVLQANVGVAAAMILTNLLPLPRLAGRLASDGRVLLEIWQARAHSRGARAHEP
jgi:hypothetical protein